MGTPLTLDNVDITLDMVEIPVQREYIEGIISIDIKETEIIKIELSCL